jgi:hypothetical protein
LERSADSRNFAGIYTITADALRCQQPFDHTDADPMAGINYYRLKMTTTDGNVTYSGIVALMNDSKGFDIISIVPNPVTNGNFKLNVDNDEASNMDIVIKDAQGRVVEIKSVKLIAGLNSINMNVTNLASGTYFITAGKAEDRSRVLRFVKE